MGFLINSWAGGGGGQSCRLLRWRRRGGATFGKMSLLTHRTVLGGFPRANPPSWPCTQCYDVSHHLFCHPPIHLPSIEAAFALCSGLQMPERTRKHLLPHPVHPAPVYCELQLHCAPGPEPEATFLSWARMPGHPAQPGAQAPVSAAVSWLRSTPRAPSP